MNTNLVAQIDGLIKAVQNHRDHPNELSQLIIELSAVNYQIGVLMADARLKEIRAAVGYLDTPSEKKMSVSEAEKRSIDDSENEYEGWKNQREDILELVQSIKKRLEVLNQEYKGSR